MVQLAPGGHLRLGAVMTREGQVLDDSELDYTTDAPARIELGPGNGSTVVFTGASADGMMLTKTFTFRRSSYVFAMDVAVTGGARGLAQPGASLSQAFA